MAASGPSPHLSPARSSCQISGRPIPVPRHAPAVKICSWRRFASSRIEVSLVPARLLRSPPRRRNALRDKASQSPPPLLLRHQVRPPCHESPKFESLDSQEPKSGSFNAEPSSDLDQELEISVGPGSGDPAWGSKLDELDVIGDADKLPLGGTRADPAFGVCKNSDGSVIQFEVGEDEFMSEAVEGESSGHVRAIAMEIESSGAVAPHSIDNSSRFHFAASVTQRMESSVLNGEVSVAQRNVPPSRNVTWNGFAVLCGICIAFVASKLIRRSSKAQFPRKLFAASKPETIEDGFDKGNLNVLSNGQKFSDGLLRKPLLDRKQLMSNIKRAQDSRKWFVLSNSFCRKDVATYDDTDTPEIRRNVAEVHTFEKGITENCCNKEQNCIVVPEPIFVIPQPIDVIEEEVSMSYSSQSYLDEVSDSNESNGISLSQDKIEESMEQAVDLKNSKSNGISLSKDKIEQSVDLKNGAPIMNMSEKSQGNIGEIELLEATYSNESANDINSMMICTLNKEAQIGSASVHESGPNSASTLPSEFESNEQYVEICEKNLDCIQGMEPFAPFINEKQLIYSKDIARPLNTNLVSKACRGLSASSSELTEEKTTLDNVSDHNGIEEIEPTMTSSNIAPMACYKEFSSHNMSMIGTEACKTPVIAETITVTSPQRRNNEDPVGLRENVRSMQEPEPSISSENDKEVSHGTEKVHKEQGITQTRMETDPKRTLGNASTPSFCTSQETVPHTFEEVLKSEKKQEKERARAHLRKKKVKPPKEVCSDKEAETEQSDQGKSRMETMVNPTNNMQKTKGVPKKRQKKVLNEMQRVPDLDDVQCISVVDQKNSNQRVKKARGKNPKNAFNSQEAQTRE